MIKTNKKGNAFPLRVKKIRKRIEQKELEVSEIVSPVFPIESEPKKTPKFRKVEKKSPIETSSFFTETESIMIDNPESVESDMVDIDIEHFCSVKTLEEPRIELKRKFVERVSNGIVIHLDNGGSIELKKHFTDASVYRMNKHMNEVYGDENVRILLINSWFITDSGDTMVVYELSEERNY